MHRPVVLVGAGFSAHFGVPTMRRFFQTFVDLAQRRYPGLRSTVDTLVKELGEEADLESMLSRLNAGVEVRHGLPPGFQDPSVAEWMEHCKTLRSHLLSFIVEMCERFNTEKAAALARTFLLRVAAAEGVFFTTNYDRIVEYVCEVEGIVLDDGFTTDPNQPVAPWNGSFSGRPVLAKLHGSVTWYEDPSEVDGFLRLDRGYPLPGPDFHLARGGRVLRPLMIVPTLEKEALHPPYMRLLTLLSDTLANSTLLITLGSSLRDQHLVELIRARRETLCSVVIGKDAERAATRLVGSQAIPFEVPAEQFLSLPEQTINELLGLSEEPDLEARADLARQLVDRERARLAEVVGLSEAQERELSALRTGSYPEQLSALAVLRGLAHPAVTQAMIEMLSVSDRSEIRAGAAGSLGLAMQADAVAALRSAAIDDSVPLVRIEAALALRHIGNEQARAAIAEHQERHPEETIP